LLAEDEPIYVCDLCNETAVSERDGLRRCALHSDDPMVDEALEIDQGP